VPTAEFCASLMDNSNTNAVSVTLTALLLVSPSFGPSLAISIFHWCLVRSWPFAGSQRFLADDDDDELMLNVLRCHLTY